MKKADITDDDRMKVLPGCQTSVSSRGRGAGDGICRAETTEKARSSTKKRLQCFTRYAKLHWRDVQGESHGVVMNRISLRDEGMAKRNLER